MKRGCLIALVIIVLVPAVLAGVGAYVADRQYGWTLADPVSHEKFAEPQTRLRAAAKLDTLVDILEQTIPPGSIPAWVPVSAGGVIPEVLPHEIAVLGGANYRENVYRLRVVVNERRGGPAIAQYLNDSGTFSDVSVIRWDPKGMRAAGRGVLLIDGTMALEEDLESKVLEQFSGTPPAAPMTLEGGHLLEVALDNTNGDLLTLISAVQTANGGSIDDLTARMETKVALEALPGLFNVRLALDRTGDDELTLQLHAGADETTGNMLQLAIGGFLLPYLKPELRKQKMEIDGAIAYEADKQALIGKYVIKGFKAPLLKGLRGA